MNPQKKAFAWNWVISGLIIGLLVIGTFTSMLNKVFMENARQDAKQQFSEIYTRTNTLCTSSEGEEDFYDISIPDIVEGIYIANDDKVFPEDFDERVKKHETFVGSYLCMKLREDRQKCRRLKCELEMSYFGQKKTVLSLADKILKKPSYTTFPTYFVKNECGVSVLVDDVEATRADTGCVFSRCNYTVLMGCNRMPTCVRVEDKMILLGDTTPFCNHVGTLSGCFVPKPTIDFAVEVANYFNGLIEPALKNNNLLIIYEDKKMDPSQANFDALKDNISGRTNIPSGNIKYFRHDSLNPNMPITLPYLDGFDQVWIFRPGWCFGQDRNGIDRINEGFCDTVVSWSGDEVKAISDYVDSGGKLFLTSDYSSMTDEVFKSAQGIRQEINVPQEVAANKILSEIREDLHFDESGCYCGCGVMSSTNYAKVPLMNGIDGFEFGAAARIMC